ncbi:MAG: HEAT repeat domain-containing protein, partial [Phototrophicaceae bacterium]
MSDNQDFDFGDFDDLGSDFEESSDDIIENYDSDDGDAELTPDQINARIDAYEKETKKNSRIVVKAKQFNKQQRLEAIRWLGESGNPQAIPSLIKVYQKDQTPGMKEEAAYALGQFKAYQRDEDDPEMVDIALQRIDDIILYDKRGKRTNSTLFILGEVILIATAIVLFGFGGVLASQNANVRATSVSQTQTAQPTPTMDTEQALQNDLEGYYQGLVNDANFYQQQLASATRGDGINCNLNGLMNPPSYTLSSMWQDNASYVAAVDGLNSTRTTMASVVSAYAQACSNGVAMPRENALDLGGTIIEVQRSLADVRTALNEAGLEITEQVFATATPLPSSTPDLSMPTATQDLALYSNTIATLERIIEDMADTRGVASSNVFNWQQVIDNNAVYLSGCNQPQPIIPENYTLDATLAGTSALLDSAVSNVNIGLESTRLSVQAFYAACSASLVPEDAAGRSAQAQLALSAFESATIDL